MIDHLDKQTQSMDLEPKRGRGRPATGQALSNADRQRAYRERQKAQRNVKSDVGTTGAIKLWEEACRNLGKANDRIRELEQQMVQQREEYNDLVHKLMTERDQLKRDLAAKPAKPRKHRDDAPLKTILVHHKAMEDRRKSGELSDVDALWRFVGATLNVIEQHGITTPK